MIIHTHICIERLGFNISGNSVFIRLGLVGVWDLYYISTKSLLKFSKYCRRLCTRIHKNIWRKIRIYMLTSSLWIGANILAKYTSSPIRWSFLSCLKIISLEKKELTKWFSNGSMLINKVKEHDATNFSSKQPKN